MSTGPPDFALRFLADENFRRAIILGLLRDEPELDIVRVHEVGLMGKPDPVVLEWAADHSRIVLSHDKRLSAYAHERIAAGKHVPGIVIVPQRVRTGPAISDLRIMVHCSTKAEWVNQVRYIPLG